MKKYLFLLVLCIPMITNAQLSTFIDAAKTYTDANIINNNVRQVTPLKVNTSINKVLAALKFIDTAAKFNEDLELTASRGVKRVINDFRLVDTVNGPGIRLQWLSQKGAFRAGGANNSQWDITNIGDYSFATGLNNIATGIYSTAMGNGNNASGSYSFAAGNGNTTSGQLSSSFGVGNTASGQTASTFGSSNIASGASAMATGGNNISSGSGSFSSGSFNTSMGVVSFSSGQNNFIKTLNGAVFGSYNDTTGYSTHNSNTQVSTDPIFVIGNGSNVVRKNALSISRNGRGTVGAVWGADNDYSADFTAYSFIHKQYFENAISDFLLKEDTAAMLAGYQPLDADLTTIAALTPVNNDIIQRKAGVWTNRTPAQFKTDLSLTKVDVGLPDADNTSDLDKPISTAMQTALDLKLNIADAYTDEKSQDATGSMVDATLIYNDGIPSLGRAAIDGDVTINAGSNTAAITAGVIVNADINAAAGISPTKFTDGSVSDAEFNFINTLTSNAQTQLTNLNSNKVTKGGDLGPLTIGTTDVTDLVLMTGSNSRWRITGAGNLIKNVTSSSFGLHLGGTGFGAAIAFGDTLALETPYGMIRERNGTDTDQGQFYFQKGEGFFTGTLDNIPEFWVNQSGNTIIGGETEVAGNKLTVIGNQDVSLNLNVQGNLTAGNIISFSGVLDFPSTAAGTSSELTIAVAGAAVGDAIAPGIPTSNANSMYEYRVSGANVVTVKLNNYSAAAINPASATFKGKLFK